MGKLDRIIAVPQAVMLGLLSFLRGLTGLNLAAEVTVSLPLRVCAVSSSAERSISEQLFRVLLIKATTTFVRKRRATTVWNI
jgi:hypothetical protein